MEQKKKPLPACYLYSRDETGCDEVWNFYEYGNIEPFVRMSSNHPDWPEFAEAAARAFATAPKIIRTLIDVQTPFNLVFGPGCETYSFIQRINDQLYEALGVPMGDWPEPPKAFGRTLLDSVDNILGHFLPAERADFNSMVDSANRDQHIFRDLEMLDFFLRRLTGKTYL
jgi:hypothetical protein